MRMRHLCCLLSTLSICSPLYALSDPAIDTSVILGEEARITNSTITIRKGIDPIVIRELADLLRRSTEITQQTRARYDIIVDQLSKDLNASRQTIQIFLQTVGQHDVPPDQIKSVLETLAANYNRAIALTQSSSPDEKTAQIKSEVEKKLSSGDTAAAETLLRDLRDNTLAQAKELDAKRTDYLRSAAATSSALAKIALSRLDYAEAVDQLEVAISLTPMRDTETRIAYYIELSSAALQLSEFRQSKSAAEDALRLAEASRGAFDENLIDALINMSFVQLTTADYLGAEVTTLRAINTMKALDHYSSNVMALLQYRLGIARDRSGNSAGGCTATIESVDILEKMLKELETTSTPSDSCVGEQLSLFGAAQLRRGRQLEASRLLERALAIKLAIYGSEDIEIADVRNDLGRTYLALSNTSLAMVEFTKALAIYERVFGSDHLSISVVLGNLSVSYQILGEMDNAETHERRNISIIKKHIGDQNIDYADAIARLASILEVGNRSDEAIQLKREALSIYETLLGAYNEKTLKLRASLPPAEGGTKALEKISEYMMGLDNLRISFTEIDKDSRVSRGQIWLKRPDKLAVRYDPPRLVEIITNGGVGVFIDNSIQQRTNFDIRETPLFYIFSGVVGQESDLIVTHLEENLAETTLRLVNRSALGWGAFEITFSRDPLAIRQWRIGEASGEEILVVVNDLDLSSPLDDSLFDAFPTRDVKHFER